LHVSTDHQLLKANFKWSSDDLVEVEMRLSWLSCGLVERLEQMLKDLDTVCKDSRGEEKQHQLLVEARTAVAKLKHFTQTEQVAGLVQAKKWAKATEM
jgi:hypothetical protein